MKPNMRQDRPPRGRKRGLFENEAAAAIGFAAVVALCVVGAMAVLFYALDLLPPKTMRMAAGAEGGAYHAIARRYRAILARDGIELEVVTTAGSVENAALLAEGAVDAALLQGGVNPPDDADVEALAAVFLEPLLVFRSAAAEVAGLSDWSRLRVAAGPPGSGTRAAVDAVLAMLDLDAFGIALEPIGGADGAAALLAGDVDAAVFVAPLDAPYLTPLLTDPAAQIVPLRDTEAVARRLPFARAVDLPAAGLDYAARIPENDTPLIAMVARLAVVGDLHPALVDRLLSAADLIHRKPSLLAPDLAFPSGEGVAMRLNAQAEAHHRDGPPPFHAALPFWVTAQINRVALVLLPVAVLLLPLLRAAPGVYAWRMRARIWRNYDQLIDIDIEASHPLSPDRRAALLAQLDTIEADARAVRVPISYRDYAYALRLHIDLVRERVVSNTGAD